MTVFEKSRNALLVVSAPIAPRTSVEDASNADRLEEDRANYFWQDMEDVKDDFGEWGGEGRDEEWGGEGVWC